MKRNEWIEQLIELEDTMPDPTNAALRERRRQMRERLLAIRDYLADTGPEPAPDWQLTVPDATEAEKALLRAKAAEWFDAEIEAMGRDLAKLEAEEPNHDPHD